MCLGRQWKKAQSLPPEWETTMELQTPVLGLARCGCGQHLENKSADTKSIPQSHPISHSGYHMSKCNIYNTVVVLADVVNRKGSLYFFYKINM